MCLGTRNLLKNGFLKGVEMGLPEASLVPTDRALVGGAVEGWQAAALVLMQPCC